MYQRLMSKETELDQWYENPQSIKTSLSAAKKCHFKNEENLLKVSSFRESLLGVSTMKDQAQKKNLAFLAGIKQMAIELQELNGTDDLNEFIIQAQKLGYDVEISKV